MTLEAGEVPNHMEIILEGVDEDIANALNLAFRALEDEEWDRAVETADRAATLAEERNPSSSGHIFALREVARCLRRRAVTLRDPERGQDLQRAAAALEAGYRLARQQGAKSALIFLLARELGQLHDELLDQPTQAIPALTHALELVDQVDLGSVTARYGKEFEVTVPINPSACSELLSNLMRCHERAGQIAEARAIGARWLQLQIERLGSDHPMIGYCHNLVEAIGR